MSPSELSRFPHQLDLLVRLSIGPHDRRIGCRDVVANSIRADEHVPLVVPAENRVGCYHRLT